MSRYIDADKFIKNERALYCKDCARRFGTKNGKLKEIYQIGEAPCKSCELNDSLDSLDDFPTADVEPVQHAHWIVDKDEGIVMCSNPDCLAEFSDNGESIEYYWNFCPNCGAKMDEKENEQ